MTPDNFVVAAVGRPIRVEEQRKDIGNVECFYMEQHAALGNVRNKAVVWLNVLCEHGRCHMPETAPGGRALLRL